MNVETLPIFKFGIGLFESMRVEKNTPQDFEEHLLRLKQACTHFQFGHFSEEKIKNEIFQRCEKLDSQKTYRLRIWCSPSAEWISSEQKMNAESIVGVEIDEYKPLPTKKLKLFALPDDRPVEFRYFKTTQYFGSFLKKRTAVEEGFDDILYVDEKFNFPHESSTAGFAWKNKNQNWLTCQPENACLPSISIQKFFAQKKEEGSKIIYCAPQSFEWDDVLEAYLISSIQGLREVESIFPFWKKVPQI